MFRFHDERLGYFLTSANVLANPHRMDAGAALCHHNYACERASVMNHSEV
jgi:hypothetical protein